MAETKAIFVTVLFHFVNLTNNAKPTCTSSKLNSLNLPGEIDWTYGRSSHCVRGIKSRTSNVEISSLCV
ncbi:hypothetical protein F2P79_007954 [Pimephales promelas]|nr:hypothetical protein F2P79_007954 [Pimephales promelas]